MSTLIGKDDIRNGYKFDHVMSWREIIPPLPATNPRIIQTLDALHDIIPFDCDVLIKNGKPFLGWDKQRRLEEISSWIEHGRDQGLLTQQEVLLAKQVFRIILSIR